MGYLEVTGPDPAPGVTYSCTEIISQWAAWLCVCDVFCQLETAENPHQREGAHREELFGLGTSTFLSQKFYEPYSL